MNTNTNMKTKTTTKTRNVRKNSLGYKGIYKKGNKFAAQLSIRHTHTKKVIAFYIGVFDTPEMAYKARTKFINGLK